MAALEQPGIDDDSTPGEASAGGRRDANGARASGGGIDHGAEHPDQRPFFRHSYLEDRPRQPLESQRWERAANNGSNARVTAARGAGNEGVRDSVNDGTLTAVTTTTTNRSIATQSTGSRPVRRASVFKEQLSSAGHSREPSGGKDTENKASGQGTVIMADASNVTELVAPAPSDDRYKTQTQQANEVGSQGQQATGAYKRHVHGDADLTAEERERDLTELAAPAPYEDSRMQTGGGNDLESAERKHKAPVDSSVRTGLLTQIYIVGYLIFFSIMGVLARQGTEWLTFYPGAPVVISNLWANFGGTFFMGFVTEDRQILREEWGDVPAEKQHRRLQNSSKARAAHVKVKKTIPLFIGLTVGFCGSYTSFSTFMRDIFLAISNNVPTPLNHPGTPPNVNATVSRSGGYSFEAALAIVILTITVNVSALYFGAHCALALDRWTPTIPFHLLRTVLDPLILFLGIGSWIGAVVLAIWPPDRPTGTLGGSWDSETWRGDVVFALVFAPVGCMMRYYLSVQLNAQVPQFPLGTFAANMFGTAVLGMCYDLQRVSLGSSALTGGGRVSCQVLQGVQDGFSGALTTVSTWANELRSLENKHSYFYGSVSVLAGFALLVIIMGSVRWTIGFGELSCNVLVT